MLAATSGVAGLTQTCAVGWHTCADRANAPCSNARIAPVSSERAGRVARAPSVRRVAVFVLPGAQPIAVHHYLALCAARPAIASTSAAAILVAPQLLGFRVFVRGRAPEDLSHPVLRNCFRHLFDFAARCINTLW